MSKRTRTITLVVDASQVEAGMEQLDKQLGEVNDGLGKMSQEIKDVDKALASNDAEKIFKELNKQVDKSVMSVKSLTEASDNYKDIALAAGLSSPIGQEALRRAAEMEGQVDGVNKQVAQLAEGGRGLNSAMALGTGVIAGWSAFAGLSAMVGEENENLQQTFVKLQGAQAALMGVTELSNSLKKEGILRTTAEAVATKLSAAATAIYTVVVGGATGAMKLFRLALASTGIGLIVVGLGLLVANFDKVKEGVKGVVDWFINLGEHVVRLIEWYNELGVVGKIIAYLLAAPIMIAVEAYQLFFGTVEKGTADMMKSDRLAAEARQAQHNEWGKQLTAELKGIKDKRKAEEEAHSERQGQYDLEIERLEALGQSSNDLKLLKLQDLQDELKEQIQFIIDSSALYEDYYEKRRAESGQSREDFIASMKAQGVDLEKLQGKQNEMIKALENKVFSSESKIFAFKRTARAANQKEVVQDNKELTAEEQKRLDDLKKLAEQHAKDLEQLQKNAIEEAKEKIQALERERVERQKVIEDLADWERQQRLDVFQIKMDDLRNQFEEEMKLFKGNDDMKLRLTEQFNAQLADIQAEANISDDEVEQARFDEKIEGINAILDRAMQALEKLSEINNIANEFGDRRKEQIQSDADQELSDLERSKQKQLNVEGLSAKRKAQIEYQSAMAEYNIKKQAAEAQDKIAERQFKRNKAIALIEIGINTASAVVKSVAASPTTFGLPFSAAAVVIGAANAALVASKNFKGSAGSISPPSFTAPSSGGGGGGSDSGSGGEDMGNRQTDITTDTDNLNKQPKIVISQVEINKTQSEMALISDLSVL